MKQLDWKSFAIGVLLTTTVMFGTGAATTEARNQYEYMIRTFDPGGFGQDKRDAKLSNDVNRLAKVGWEIDSFHALGDTQNARSRVVFKRLLKDD